MTEDSPNSLAQPRVTATTMSKTVLAILAAILCLVLAILAYSVMMAGESRQQPVQQAPAPSGRDSAPLAGEPEGSGIAAQPTAKNPEPASDTDPRPAPPLSPRFQAYLQQRDQIRQMRMQMELQALQAPLTVSLGGSQAANSSGPARSNVLLPSAQSPGRTHSSALNEVNDREDKEAFLESRSGSGDSWRLANARVAGVPFELKTGTVIPALMLTGINSDLPGKLIGQVSQNVYDTATGAHLLIPQGSRLFGVYDSRVAMGQERVLIAWNRIIFPDGSSVDIGSMPGSDQAGYAGFHDRVNNHYLRIFGTATLMSLVTGGMAWGVDRMNNNSGSDDNPTMQDEMGTALASQLGQASLQLLQQNVSIKPTLEIRPGFRFNIVLIKDIAFDRPYAPMKMGE